MRKLSCLVRLVMMSCAIIFLCLEQTVTASVCVVLPHKNTSCKNKSPESWRAWHFPHPVFHQSPVTRLPVLANGQSGMPSNANNFHGGWNASVNPRTGSSSFGMVLSEIMYDSGKSKRSLALSYSGTPTPGGADSFDLGPQWSWNVGTERPSSSERDGHQITDITTSDGHSFTMEELRDPEGEMVWRPLRHKLGDVTITGEPKNWTVALSSGIREHILDGYEDWEETRDGHRVWFYYDKNGDDDSQRRLVYVCARPLSVLQVDGAQNACNDGIWLTYQSDSVTVHGPQTVSLYKTKEMDYQQVDRIELPSLSSDGMGQESENSVMRFIYDSAGNRPWLLSKVISPTSAYTSFLYNEEADREDARIQGLSAGINDALIPVVTEQITHENNGAIADKKLWYYYGRQGMASGQAHNYTGFQGNNTMIPGRDNLFDCPDIYTYQVTVDNGLTSTTTTYNKYHLPILVTQKSDKNDATVGQKQLFYPQWKNTTFARLPANYSLPLVSESTLFSPFEPDSDSSNIKVLKQKKYNTNGQLIWQKDAWGRETFIQYCPATGDEHCPALDPEWPQVTKPEKVLFLPRQPVVPKGIFSVKSAGLNNTSPMAKEVEFNYMPLKVLSPPSKSQTPIQKRTTNFWEVKEKRSGVIATNSLQKIQPGSALPELQKNQLTNETLYHYDTSEKSQNYGGLVQLVITKYPEPVPQVKSRFLNLSKSPVPVRPPKTVIVDIHHKFDPATHTRSVTTDIAYAPDQKSFGTRLVASSLNGIINIGTVSYSLRSGTKMSSYDAMKDMGVTWFYDLWNRPVKKVMTPGNGGYTRTVTWKYIVTSGQIAVIKTDEDGHQEKTVMGDNHKVISVWHRYKEDADNRSGKNDWIEDMATSYTRTGKPATRTIWIAADSVNGKPGKAEALTTTYGYDSLNRKVWERFPDGQIKFIVRDDPAMRVITYQAAAGVKGKGEKLHPLLQVVQSNLLGKPDARYTFVLDPDAKKKGKPLYCSELREKLTALIHTLEPTGTLLSENSSGILPQGGKNGLLNFIDDAIRQGAWIKHTTFIYDSLGRRVQQKEGNGVDIRWSWQNGHLAMTTTPDGRVIHDSFDTQGKKVSRCVQPSGSNVCHVLGTRGYDSSGKLLWQADETGNIVKYTYDNDGRKTSMIMPTASAKSKGHVITWHYNSFGVTEADIDGKPYVKYVYDPVTWRLTDKEDQISHLHYQYDKDTGNIAKITRSAPASFKTLSGFKYPSGTTIYRWNRYNQITGFKDITGIWYTATHDLAGRVTHTFVTLPGAKKPALLTMTTYDTLGRVVTMTNGAGLERSFTYDAFGNLASTIDSKDNKVLQKMGYTHDPETGNILTFTRMEGKASATQRYTYDLTNNLVSMSCNATGKPGEPDNLCPRDTDISGSGLSSPPIILAQHYTFDHWNNIQSVSETLASGDKKISKKVKYTYASSREGQDSERAYDPHRMLAFNVHWSSQREDTKPAVISYDRLGRMIKDINGNTLHYNAFGRQDSFTNKRTGIVTHYFYDSDGHQVAEQSFNNKGQPVQKPLYMIYYGNRVAIQSQEDNTGKTRFSVELGGVAHAEDGKIVRWYLHDYKGDVVAFTDNKGARASDNVYSPYGMRYDLSGMSPSAPGAAVSWQNHMPGFDGQMSDPATGYQFLGGGYRAYNPVYRHFMSRDSFSPFKEIDDYGFVGNNPVMNTDPTGHMKRWVGYMMAGLGLLMTIALGVLMPLAAAGSVAATASSVSPGVINAITIASSIAASVVSLASGSLQVASTALPDNKNVAIANAAFGIASGIFAMGLSGGSIISGAIIAKAASGMYRVSTSLIISSGISGMLAGGLSASTSAMSEGLAVDSNLGQKSGYFTAMRIMNSVSMGLMVVSAGLGFIFEGGVVGKKIADKIAPVSESNNDSVEGIDAFEQNEAAAMENERGQTESSQERVTSDNNNNNNNNNGRQSGDELTMTDQLEQRYADEERYVTHILQKKRINVVEDDVDMEKDIKVYSLEPTSSLTARRKYLYIPRRTVDRLVRGLVSGKITKAELDGMIANETFKGASL